MFRIHVKRLALPFLSLCAVVAVGAFGLPRPALADGDDRAERLQNAREVYVELTQSSDHKVPDYLLERARAVAVFPHVIKGAIGFGARYGKGVVSVRGASGHWSAPAFFTLTGGSWGLQLGAESAEVVLFFMSDRSVRSLLKSKFTLGGKAGLAAGPFGRTAEADTDARLTAEIYSYAKSKGLFAGISLEGARLAPDEDSNRIFYGGSANAEAIVLHGQITKPPAAAEAFVSALPQAAATPAP
jgi:lipid-binding SYLF domain-containing protein